MMQDEIILDTNLLILLIVGMAGEHLYRNHKNLKNFDLPTDFQILRAILDQSNKIILTPNTLTETSNLLRQIARPARDQLSNALNLFIQNSPEVYIRSADAATGNDFLGLGLTDAALLCLAAERASTKSRLLLTMDLDLYLAAMALGLKAINFNEFRNM